MERVSARAWASEAEGAPREECAGADAGHARLGAGLQLWGGGEGEGLQKHGAALSAPGGVTGLSGAPLLGVLCPCFACLFCKNGVFVFMTNFQLTSWEP